jgi:hypothetical protein
MAHQHRPAMVYKFDCSLETTRKGSCYFACHFVGGQLEIIYM